MPSFLSAVLLAASFMLGLPAGAAEARSPLRDVPEIADGIFTIVVANEIRRKCDDIDGRLFRGIKQIHRLKARANALGYSDGEIRTLLDSKVEKARMIERGKSYMAGVGLDYDKPGDLCRLGRMEIKNNSAIGALLRAK
ncbi:DUF5333 domain-containing protein [Antarcticimicrobium sediminis]|uniref:DUF5333 domain-containing protein n=1 Tax=Antarcticimicrobium sediminis TaxID=2546227 RepID=A0A4R5EYV3_9RHOB|nr:DUF5333 domain-containing protein [Antarcticimicrobium sediminis]TDE40213.1 hypothetical protein E1B25_04480 [Antarcticimicrobium sediminis]